MLSGISNSDYNPKGKKSNEMCAVMRKQNFEIGIKEWERPLGSVYKYQYYDRKFDANTFKAPHPSTSQVMIPHEHGLSQNKINNHFKSETNKSYVNYVKPERRRPLLSTEDLVQSKFVGESLNHGFKYNRDVKSQSQLFHNDFKGAPQSQDVRWKPQRERFNPITNEVYTTNTLSKASQFDFFNHLKEKSRVSHNFSELPRPKERVDIITGRKLPPF